MLGRPVSEADRKKQCSAPVMVGEGRWRRCHSRSEFSCEYCATIEHGDEIMVALDGILGDDGELASEFQFWFVTLTAPGFGRVHFAPDKNRRTCHCGVTHDPDDDIVGYPCGSYRFEDQVLWNAASGRLWKNFSERLVYAFPEITHWKVAELQARGAVHFHLLMRFPVDALVTESRLQMILGRARVENRRGREVRFGRQADFKPVTRADAVSQVYYASKALGYSLKDYTKPEGGNSTKMFRRLASFARNFKCDDDCRDCLGRNDCRPAAYGQRGHRGCVGQNPKPGKTPCVGCKNPIHWNLLGSTHRVTKSRRWALSGLTKQKLQQRRLEFALGQVDAERDQARADGTSTAFEAEHERKLQRIAQMQEQRESERLARSYTADATQRHRRSRGA